MEELADLARSLVSTPSHEDPSAAGDLIERWLREETDAAVTRDAVGNVIGRRTADGPTAPTPIDERASLALVGHHDVVPPDDEQVADGEYVLEAGDGRLYGRGTADMKGALAAAMLAFRDAELPANAADLVFASFVGEEVGGEGARHAIEEGFRPDAAIVGEGSTGYSEPGVTDVAVAHKGRRASTIVAHGESAHASVPEEGVNAIYRACEAVEELRSATIPTTEIAGERIEGSLTVTGIEGGTAWNVVPDRCTVTVDERTVPGERTPIDAAVDRAGLEWLVDQDLPPMQCTDAAFADLVLTAARTGHDTEGGDPRRVVKPHATDAGWLADAGVACVVCGPAEPGEAHTADESVSLSVLGRCRGIYREAAERFVTRGTVTRADERSPPE